MICIRLAGISRAVRVQRNSIGHTPRAIRQFAPVRTLIDSIRNISTHSRSISVAKSASAEHDDHQELVYTAPMARTVRIMKGVSLTSCTLTSIGTPTLCFLSEQSASAIGKWAMCGTIMLFGFGTTSLFHVLFKPYVMRMWIDRTTETASDPLVTVETLTLFAQLTRHQFRLSEVALPEKSLKVLMVSFRANDKHFFIHPECLEDQVLVQKLMGEQYRPAVKQKTTDIDDDEF